MPTTEEEIRDYMIALIRGLTPRLLEHDRFEVYRDEEDADFVEWTEAHVQGSLRRFQVRSTGSIPPPDVTNTDVEALTVTFQILVAYPQTHRAGRDNARDRDDMMSADLHQIQQTVGLNGYRNFTGIGGNPDASWITGENSRVIGNGVDYLVIRQTMRFFRRQFT